MSDSDLNKIALGTVAASVSAVSRRIIKKTGETAFPFDDNEGGGVYTVAQEKTIQNGLSPAKSENLQAVAVGIVSGLVESAELHARQIVTPSAHGSATAAQVWADMLESLQECGLSPNIYCTRSGRCLSVVSPDYWSDYLTQIAELGESALGDTMRGQLLNAIIAQKAYTVAPVVLTTSGASLAMIRETSAPDFLAVALGHIFPASERWQADTLALRAEQLGAARQAMALLPDSALQYTCEVVTLYLSYIRPALIASENSLLTHYRDDIAAPFQSVETLGHFCGRVVQMLVQLLAQHSLRPVNQISPRDLRALRVHWQGFEPYRVLRQARRDWRAGKDAERKRLNTRARLEAKRDLFKMVSGGKAYERRIGDVSHIADDLLDAFDFSAVLSVAGRAVPVVTQGDEETAQALAKASELRAMRERRQEQKEQDAQDDLDLEGLDIASLLLSDTLPFNFVSHVDDDELELSLGLLDFDDLDDDDDDDDLLGRLLDEQQSDALEAALQEADKQGAKPRRKISLAAQDRADNVNKAASALAFPSPKRRVIGATPAPAAPVPRPSSALPRRVIRT